MKTLNFRQLILYVVMVMPHLFGRHSQAIEPNYTNKVQPQSAISESLKNDLIGLNKTDEIAKLCKLASDDNIDKSVRFSALLLLSSYRDEAAVRTLLENLAVVDYSLPRTPGTGNHPTTRDEYIRLGLFQPSDRGAIGTNYTPAVWALGKIGGFALPQILEYMKSASEDNLQRSANAISLIIGNQKDYHDFIQKNMSALPKSAQRALLSQGSVSW